MASIQRTTALCVAAVLWAVGGGSGGDGRREAAALEPSPVRSDEAMRTDWLIDPTPYAAKIVRSDDGRSLELTNGLVRRTFQLQPNAATTALDQLTTGESLLRGVKPEATVTIDGRTYDVGGLVGQPNYAFLQPDWIKTLKASPTALQFVGYEQGRPQERLAWKRVRRHEPGAKWPPAGVALRLDFRPPDAELAQNLPSDAGRSTLWDEPFKSLSDAWTVVRSERDARVSFADEGRAGAIVASAGAHCFALRKLDRPAALVEAVIDPGTDGDTSWGPGLTLVFGERRVELNLRPGDRGAYGHFELRDGGAEHLATVAAMAAPDKGLDVRRTYRLRVRIEADALRWEAAVDGPQPVYVPLFSVAHDGGAPTAVAVGKTDRRGGASDSETAEAGGELRRCQIRSVRAFGPFDPEKVDPALRKGLAGPTVSVHYELYDGLPCYSKWITVTNGTSRPLVVERFTSELLAAVEPVSEVDELSVGATPPNLHVETDMAMGGMSAAGANRRSFRWKPDPDYATQVNYERRTPCLLEVGPESGPAVELPPGETFVSYRVWVLAHDSTDRERKGLAMRRFYRTVAPWTTENPLMMHLVASDEASVRRAIDQCAEVGFEMLILSFGSGFDMENRDPAVLERARRFSEYARSKEIEIGSYSLLASRSVGPADDVVSPAGRRPVFGASPCLCSEWGGRYFDRLYEFHRHSGFTLLEHDGSYPGDECVSERHPGHRGSADSRWRQWRSIDDFYRWCRGEGIFLNVPDYYFLSGSNKTGMGYRETNWSLPREQQVIHTRQNIYDGTWEKTPSMGWMFVPLTQYHGGGAAATIEPLSEHLDHYARMLDCNLALGVQACYRGPRLFDTDSTREMVREKTAWFKRHRDILESDLIHGRRADARDVDWMLHVNPRLEERALLAAFNPLPTAQRRTIRTPLYYAGLRGAALVEDRTGAVRRIALDRTDSAELQVELPAGGMA